MFKPLPQVTVHPDQCPHSSQAGTTEKISFGKVSAEMVALYAFFLSHPFQTKLEMMNPINFLLPASVVLAIEVVEVIRVELVSVVFVVVLVPTLFKHTACISVHSGNISGSPQSLKWNSSRFLKQPLGPRSTSSAHVEESQVLNLSKVVECSSAAAIQSDADLINFSSGQDSGLANTSYSPPEKEMKSFVYNLLLYLL